jgi:hypothetical protein
MNWWRSIVPRNRKQNAKMKFVKGEMAVYTKRTMK